MVLLFSCFIGKVVLLWHIGNVYSLNIRQRMSSDVMPSDGLFVYFLHIISVFGFMWHFYLLTVDYEVDKINAGG